MKKESKKMAASILTAILLVILYIIIFRFSDQDGETSGSISHELSESCVEIVNNVGARNWSEEVKSRLAGYFEHPIRKLAHFTEYACMGILVSILLGQWMARGARMYFCVTGWVLVSALLDEFHQMFTPGRCNSLWDVLLDTFGGVCGLGICLLIENVWKKRSKR